MANRRSKRTKARRDRRKAKASNWRRPWRQSMGAAAGHGAGIGSEHVVPTVKSPRVKVVPPKVQPRGGAALGTAPGFSELEKAVRERDEARELVEAVLSSGSVGYFKLMELRDEYRQKKFVKTISDKAESMWMEWVTSPKEAANGDY